MSNVPVDDRGRPDRAAARKALEYTVVVSIKLENLNSSNPLVRKVDTR